MAFYYVYSAISQSFNQSQKEHNPQSLGHLRSAGDLSRVLRPGSADNTQNTYTELSSYQVYLLILYSAFIRRSTALFRLDALPIVYGVRRGLKPCQHTPHNPQDVLLSGSESGLSCIPN